MALPIPVRRINKYTESEWAVILGEHESIQHLLLALGDVTICPDTIQAHRRMHGLKALPNRYRHKRGPRPNGTADDVPTGRREAYVPSALQAEPRDQPKYKLRKTAELPTLRHRITRRRSSVRAARGFQAG